MPIFNNMISSDGNSSDDGDKGDNTSRRAVDKGVSGDQTRGETDGSGLNPGRIRGFGMPTGSNNQAESPSLNDMRARQGAIVAKFMTFYKRKSTLVIEMYEACFYKQKPRWDQIENFVYNDLCPTDDLRKSVKDVQLHPVKMLIFVRFSEDKIRDYIATK